MNIKTIYWIIFAILISISFEKVFAQEDFEKWLKKEKENIDSFISNQDKAFANFLEKDWKEFKINQGLKVDDKPKPKIAPKLDTDIERDIENEFIDLPSIKLPSLNIEKKKERKPEKEIREKIETLKNFPADFIEVGFNFYGNKQLIKIPNSYKEKLEGKLDNKSISNYWKLLSANITEAVIIQIEDSVKKMQLNDWGILTYTNLLAKSIHPTNPKEEHLLVWYLLNQLGYKTKVCYSGDKTYLVVPSRNKIFSISLLRGDIEDERNYIFDLSDISRQVKGNIYTYEGNYPKASKPLDMGINLPLQINKIENKKELKFNYQAIEYNVPVLYDSGNIDFLKDYPYTNLDVYFNSEVFEPTKNSLLNSLQQIIKDKPEPVAANILLRFVQTAFGYKTDDVNFGREKPLFAEETLFYSDSDCEDRAVLFSFLIKNLLNLKVIGLDYPGHVATAVKFNVSVPGDNLVYKGETFTICDPTYINAYIGMAMPEVKGLQLENIIELK